MAFQLMPITRGAVALAQGVALYRLYQAYDAHSWPATDGLIFAPLLLVAIFIPTLVVVGLGDLRGRTLVAWAGVATLLLAALGAYDIFRDPIEGYGTPAAPRIIPLFYVWVAAAACLFIAHALIVAADTEKKLIAAYPTYFAASWKHGIQVALAGLFVGIFWALLFLGAELFRLIRIEFLADLIKERWFWIPVTTMVFAYAIHVADVRAAIVRGVRTLTLTLLSWLLPMMALIAACFLLALPFTGLEPLWSTRRATAVLLLAAAALIFLVNASYQDGQHETPVARILRLAGTVTAFLLVPLVALAAYGLSLRIRQYGWTPERIIALACVTVAACYALGYAFAAARPGAWLKWLEAANVFTACVVVAVLVALGSPVADPARISVADQVARLETGMIAPEKFDFAFLRFKSGRFGRQALDRLKQKQDGVNAAQIARKAGDAIAWRSPYDAGRRQALTPQERAANISVVYPKGERLPDSFLQQDWNSRPAWSVPSCLTGIVNCDAILADLDGDGAAEILIFGPPPTAFKLAADQKWTLLGIISNATCAGVREALQRGDVAVVVPELKELLLDGQRLRVQSGGCK